MQTLRETLLSTDIELEIIPTKILGKVIEAARKKLFATQLLGLRLGPQDIPGSKVTVILQTVDTISINKVSEGAEVPVDVEQYSSFDLTPVKYGVRPVITKEMIEDAAFGVVERNIEYAGYKMAEKLDALILKEIETGADANTTGHMVSGGAAITIANIAAGMLFLEADGYRPTDFIIGPEIASDIRQIDTFVEADKAGVTNPSKSLIGTIYGMKVWVSRNVNNVEYAYIIDRDWALCLAEKRPITMERYDDVTKDLTGIVFTARWHARYLRMEACAHIECS